MSQADSRVLVIDSSKNDREEFSAFLSNAGYRVDVAADLEQGLALAAEQMPDIVFADLDHQQIKDLPFLTEDEQSCPIVIMARLDSAGDVVACLRAGASDVILKPIEDLQSVGNLISQLLDKVRVSQVNKQLQQELEERNLKLAQGLKELSLDQKAGLQVQMKMLPESPESLLDMHFAHIVKPSLYLSGDFLDYFTIDKHRALFYFADVSGHGASSAFVTVLLKNLSMRLKRNLKRGSSDDLSQPSDFLKRVNQELMDSDLDKHITVFVGHIDERDRTLTYAIGGHFPLPIIKEGCQASYLDGRGVALGLFESPEFKVYTRPLADNFEITVFSDGILEVIEGASLQDKEKLLLDVVSQGAPDIKSMLSALGLDEIEELPDDIAVLTVKGGGNAKPLSAGSGDNAF